MVHMPAHLFGCSPTPRACPHMWIRFPAILHETVSQMCALYASPTPGACPHSSLPFASRLRERRLSQVRSRLLAFLLQ
eukprot:358669-Chlamydomonas_euryale.AAC.8